MPEQGSTLLSAVDYGIDNPQQSLQLQCIVPKSRYTHTLDIKKGSQVLLTLTGLTLNTTYWQPGSLAYLVCDLTQSQNNVILNAMANVKTLQVTYTLTTFDGTVQVGTASEITGLVKTSSQFSSPLFSGFTFKDNNTRTVSVTNNDQKMVQRLSSLLIICTPATPRNGASIIKYTATINGVSHSSTTTRVLYGPIPVSGEFSLLVTVEDSRGYTAEVTKSVEVIEYTNISIETWKAHRRDNVDAEIELNFTGSLSPLSIDGVPKNNFVSAAYRYKETSSSEYGNWMNIPASGLETTDTEFSYNNPSSLTLDAQKNYHLQVRVEDKITRDAKTLVIAQGIPLVSFRSGKVGINTPDPQAPLDVVGDIRMDGVKVSDENHTHSAADITSGALPIAHGGTGATSGVDALAALGYGGEVCSTPAATKRKVVTISSNYHLSLHCLITVTFQNGNTAANPTLDVDGNNFPIIDCYTMAAIGTEAISVGMVALLVCNGLRWVLLNPNR